MKRALLSLCFVGCGLTATTTYAQLQTSAGVQYLQCMPKDQSGDFSDLSNTYFLADSLAAFLCPQVLLPLGEVGRGS